MALDNVRGVAVHRVIREASVLACFVAGGIAVTWPRVTYLDGRLPRKSDEGSYVWDLWWMAHQVGHLGNPWFTRAVAAPAGTALGFHTLMPLPGLLMTPVTLTLGPVVAFNLLCAMAPGLACYTMYRAARLRVPSLPGAVAAGAFFGLSSNVTWRAWYHLNLALGVLFLPLTLEAAVRLRRDPGRRQAVVLGLVLGASALVDQEMTVMAAIVACVVLLPWLAGRPSARRLAPTAAAGLVGLVVAWPQLAAMAVQVTAGAAPHGASVSSLLNYGAGLPQLLGPSPRVASYGLTSLGAAYYHGHTAEGLPTSGVALTAAAIVGAVTSWRRRGTRLLALGWIGCAALDRMCRPRARARAVDRPDQVRAARPGVAWARLSAIMPYTWLAHLSVLGDLREADRFTLLGMVPAALLAASAVTWLWRHAKLVAVGVLLLGVLEAGGPGTCRLRLLDSASPRWLPRCQGSTARSRPTTPGRSWSTPRSGCGAGPRCTDHGWRRRC